jgi:hypothetical protein
MRKLGLLRDYWDVQGCTKLIKPDYMRNVKDKCRKINTEYGKL